MTEDRGHRIQALFGAKGTWTMILDADWLILRPGRGASGEEIVVPREDLPDRVHLKDPAIGGPILQVRTPRATGFRVGRRAANAYAEWRGPVTRGELRASLRGMSLVTIPIGVLWIVGSLPAPADAEAGLPAVPLDALGMLLGVGLVSLGILRLLVLTRWLLVLDAVWWVGLALHGAMGVVGGASLWWGITVIVGILFAMADVQAFRRFPPDEELAEEVSPAAT